MIDARRKFLTTLFASLEANGVRYCILRNYDDLYANVETDVDLIVSPHSLKRFERCLREAADNSGFHFVHAARYVNYSYVFWHPVASFLRIDFETDVRWRFFTVLTAREILDRRQRYQEFFIPHPEHESTVLFVAAIWRGEMSERYRRQLGTLYQACSDRSALTQTLVKGFGRVGHALAAFQAEATRAKFDRALCQRTRWSLVTQSHLNRMRVAGLIHNTIDDIARFWERLQRPAGVSLLHVSSNANAQDFDALKQRIEYLFPVKKCLTEAFDGTANVGEPQWTWAMRWRRWKTMFKGGLYMRTYRVQRDEDLPRAVRAHARYVYAARAFVCVEDATGRLYFGHVNSGFMSTTEPHGTKDFSQLFIEFISEILERAMAPLATPRPRRGRFCVLLGLDGSGKTTLGRNLCDVALAGGRFRGVRYFHWRPKLLRHVEFPLPEFRNTERKAPLKRNAFNALLSSLRLVKNVVLAKLAWQFRVRPLLARGYLVIVDRYFYNYRLDPASVKYAGSIAWLDRMQKLFPKAEVVVKLRAPPEVLLARKQELSPEEIQRQATVLDELDVESVPVVVADATQPARELARQTMTQIGNASGAP